MKNQKKHKQISVIEMLSGQHQKCWPIPVPFVLSSFPMVLKHILLKNNKILKMRKNYFKKNKLSLRHPFQKIIHSSYHKILVIFTSQIISRKMQYKLHYNLMQKIHNSNEENIIKVCLFQNTTPNKIYHLSSLYKK